MIGPFIMIALNTIAACLFSVAATMNFEGRSPMRGVLVAINVSVALFLIVAVLVQVAALLPPEAPATAWKWGASCP